jgi:hypothetical protein
MLLIDDTLDAHREKAPTGRAKAPDDRLRAVSNPEGALDIFVVNGAAAPPRVSNHRSWRHAPGRGLLEKN